MPGEVRDKPPLMAKHSETARKKVSRSERWMPCSQNLPNHTAGPCSCFDHSGRNYHRGNPSSRSRLQLVTSGGWLYDLISTISSITGVWDVTLLSLGFLFSWIFIRTSDRILALIMARVFDTTIPLQHQREPVIVTSIVLRILSQPGFTYRLSRLWNLEILTL